jgi:hypothetical protein
MSRKNGRRLSDKDTRQAKIQTGIRVAGIDGKTAPPRPWSIAARRSGFAFARVPGVERRLERMRGARRRRHRNAAGRTDPSFRDAVAGHLKRVLKNYALYDSFEISDPRWVHSIKGWTWLTCVRFREQGRVRNYALFLDGNQIVDDRFAVQTDNCDLQTFYPFERMPTGLAPLH